METKYGDIVLRRLNKSGTVCLLVALILVALFSVLDALWANGIITLPSILEPQYQILYFLWVAFIFVCLGIDKVSIGEMGFVISTLFTKKSEIEKTELAYVAENGEELLFVPIVATLGLSEPFDFKSLKRRPGVLVISSKYREKVLERGYEIRFLI